MTDETAWRAFKRAHDRTGIPPCPFCGIQHKPAMTHPYCDMATWFRFWIQAGMPKLRRRRRQESA